MVSLLRLPCGFAVWLVMSASLGCSQEKLGELADRAKQVVADGADQVKQQAGVVVDSAKEELALAGSCEIALDAKVATSSCYFQWIPQGSGRPNILQVRSDRDPEQESFPSVMLHARVAAGGLSELVGQTIPAQLFVQVAPNQAIWSCPADSPVELKILELADHQITLEITGGSVVNSQTGARQTVTGKLVGIPR